jgi:hypothetical protein
VRERTLQAVHRRHRCRRRLRLNLAEVDSEVPVNRTPDSNGVTHLIRRRMTPANPGRPDARPSGSGTNVAPGAGDATAIVLSPTTAAAGVAVSSAVTAPQTTMANRRDESSAARQPRRVVVTFAPKAEFRKRS